MKGSSQFEAFADREEAGRRLAAALAGYRGIPRAVVLGLPRGGVVTAAAIAEELGLALDVLVVRKLGTPGQEELAMGAIGPGGIRVLNEDVVDSLRISDQQIETTTRRETAEPRPASGGRSRNLQEPRTSVKSLFAAASRVSRAKVPRPRSASPAALSAGFQ